MLVYVFIVLYVYELGDLMPTLTFKRPLSSTWEIIGKWLMKRVLSLILKIEVLCRRGKRQARHRHVRDLYESLPAC